MRVMTWLGTRPEIIRLSRVIPLLDSHCEHTLVHTGQNYDESLSDRFFRDLQVRQPDLHLGIRASSFGEQAAAIIEKSFRILSEHRPDRVLILGDTNSGLAAISAARLRIPVYHMEAGNRCYDDRVPEEINRRIIDHSSAVLMPYTHRSKENLIREGIARPRIAVTGNPIFEVLEHYRESIDASAAMSTLGVAAGRYMLVTLHRAENVDEESRLRGFLDGLSLVATKYETSVIVSTHPRTADKLRQFGLSANSRVRLIDPLGFFDFVFLQKHALCVLTDSGTVQEEACIFGVPNVTLRDVTERGETVECGSNVLSGGDPENIVRCVDLALSRTGWTPPAEYLERHVAQTVAGIVLGYAV